MNTIAFIAKPNNKIHRVDKCKQYWSRMSHHFFKLDISSLKKNSNINSITSVKLWKKKYLKKQVYSCMAFGL